jgi:HAD superfamily hydrolase (TIGR01509 family)
MSMKVLIFDCDGVLADTERDGHRVAFNRAFAELGIEVYWGVDFYGELLEVAGGKERVRQFFNASGWPEAAGDDKDGYLAQLHARKSQIYQAMVAGGTLPLRSGITRIVDDAHAAGIKLAVCSTASMESVLSVMDLMGQERKSRFEFVLAGDVVSHKKPDPAIYLLAQERLGLKADECMVIEDSRIGMRSALAAGMSCIITTSAYTRDEDFSGAKQVVNKLGDPPDVNIRITDLQQLCA